MKHQGIRKFTSENKLVGAFAVHWITEDSALHRKMQILEIIGDYVLVQFLSTAKDEPRVCSLHSLADIYRDDWDICLDYNFFTNHVNTIIQTKDMKVVENLSQDLPFDTKARMR
jgi:hypothetical protein